MALAGLKPVVEMRVADFALCAMDEIVNQAAKNRFMFGGQGRVPLVMRAADRRVGAHRRRSIRNRSKPGLHTCRAWWCSTPATPQDNYSMLRAALQADDPVVYMEHREWSPPARWIELSSAPTIGCAAVGRRTHIQRCRELGRPPCTPCCMGRRGACSARASTASVIDLGALWPWDRDVVLADVARTAAPAGGAHGSGAGRRLRRRGRPPRWPSASAAAWRGWARRASRWATRPRWRRRRASRWMRWCTRRARSATPGGRKGCTRRSTNRYRSRCVRALTCRLPCNRSWSSAPVPSAATTAPCWRARAIASRSLAARRTWRRFSSTACSCTRAVRSSPCTWAPAPTSARCATPTWCCSA